MIGDDMLLWDFLGFFSWTHVFFQKKTHFGVRLHVHVNVVCALDGTTILDGMGPERCAS